MNSLKIFERADHVQAVSAKELFGALGMDKSNWAGWYKINITGNRFALENQDYIELVIATSSNNRFPSRDFALTLDFAKRLCMLTRTEKGEQIRNYFIECEKKLHNHTQVDTTRIRELEDRVAQLEQSRGPKPDKVRFNGRTFTVVDYNDPESMRKAKGKRNIAYRMRCSWFNNEPAYVYKFD